MSAIYETDKLLAEYLLFHYGSAEETLPSQVALAPGMSDALDFASRTARLFGEKEVERGLDLGCAVGRSTFEMARSCRSIVGMDFSARFIQAAEGLRTEGQVAYRRLDEARLSTPLMARMPAGIDPKRVRFMVGDAMDLPDDIGVFDRVHAANLLCRLREPLRLLTRLPDLVVDGGELVLVTPCTWLEEFTPQENWPSGSTLDWLRDQLEPAFILKSTSEEPFLIRETARKFQWTCSLASIWQRQSAH
ncbi:MAG: putative 4-mercaptohistidine N1-methyltransferase [Luteolibacter sp.]